MKQIFSSLLLLFISQTAISQKKEIDYRAYNDWKKLEAHCISNDGNFVFSAGVDGVIFVLKVSDLPH